MGKSTGVQFIFYGRYHAASLAWAMIDGNDDDMFLPFPARIKCHKLVKLTVIEHQSPSRDQE